jgi:beta-lactamase class D
MWAWYFKMRFYNTRHSKKGRQNKCSDDSSTEAAQEETWICVGYATAENEVVYFKRYLDSEGNIDIDAELERARKWASLKDFSSDGSNEPI